MTLHEAMIEVMRGNGPMMTCVIADKINAQKLYLKEKGTPVDASQISARANKNKHLFVRVGNCLMLKSEAGKADALQEKPVVKTSVSTTKPKKKDRDESYVIDLCDEVIGEKASRQHRFDFLRGDAGTKLPVDAYYPSKNLVVEYYEKQHSESVKIFDKEMTASGVSRNEQRRIYDERRREVLPPHGFMVVVIDYSELAHNPSNKKLLRSKTEDVEVIKRILSKYF